MKIQIAQIPCYPPYSVVVGDGELWDGDCASGSEAKTIELCKMRYGVEPIMWDSPEHYSQRKG